jgi:pimeloyl-ACP methyl ester carboxylesterase
MRRFLCLSFCFFLFKCVSGLAQTLDTMINVGRYSLHFTIIKGKNTPILFEAGGGNDARIWSKLTGPIAEITGATVITYDRPGLGKSGSDSSNISIENDISGLENGLRQLGYQNKIMLVSHSLGGFYSTLYAARHSGKIPAIVFIDVNLPDFFTPAQFDAMEASAHFKQMVETVRRNRLTARIPLTDIVSENTLFEGTPDAARWKKVHQDFVSAAANRTGITALATGHYVFLQNTPLVINAIATRYANDVMPAEKYAIIERGYCQALTAANEAHKNLADYQHSENDLNEWGYALLNKKAYEQAIAVFKLNTTLHPESANVYDSLGDAYRKNGNVAAAIESYRRVLELNPKSVSAQNALKDLVK